MPTDPHAVTRVTVAPYAEPVSLAETKAHLRLDAADEDELVAAWASAARRLVEDATNRQLVTATLRLALDRFPHCNGEIVVPRAPLQSVTSITYVDENGDSQTLSADDYRVDAESEPGRITPAYGESWPATRCQTGAVVVTFRAGHLTPFTAAASSATLTARGRTFTTNDVVRVFNSGGALPTGLSAGTDYHVVNASGSTFGLATSQGGSAITVTAAGQGAQFVGNPGGDVGEVDGLRAAIKLLVGHWNENREAVLSGTISKEIEFAVESLVWQRKVFV